MTVRSVRRCASGFARIAACALVAMAGVLSLSTLAAAQEQTRHHALSLIGKPAYPPDMTAFKWVNPNAPRGGRLRQFALGTFDTLNPYAIQGTAATGLTLMHSPLMLTSLDEPSTEYCLLCEWVSYPADYGSVTFKLRDNAVFHDGSPITVEDVIFSLEAIKKANPRLDAYYRNVIAAEKTGDREVTFRFNEKNNRELPQILGQLDVLSKAYWTGTGANGQPRDLSKSTMEIPVGSGPYQIRVVDPGRTITFGRVERYWADDLPVFKGQYNFDELTWEYFRDSTAGLESFKSGALDVWTENSAKRWATEFVFPAVQSGEVKRKAFEVERVAGMQAFVFNTRRAQFADPRVRRAFNYAFDFEWANANLFYGQYQRLDSYFDNSELAAEGLPTGRELEILETVRDKVPPEVFTTPYKNPVYDTPDAARANLREASKLLAAAGWKIDKGTLRNAKGEALTAEFLLADESFERVVLPYIQKLKLLGIDARARVVDAAQYQRRSDTFDFDIMVDSFGQSLSPGNEQRDFWGSAAADRQGSQNSIGIKNPAIDTLIERLIFSKDREDLVAATKALDRVLLWNHYVVPQWTSSSVRVAWWNRIEHPESMPTLTPAVPVVWWSKSAKGAQ